jgi:hypothetical protein
MKVIAISNPHGIRSLLNESQSQGYITFIYHHADPKHELLADKFLYIHSDEELCEKLHLLKIDVAAQDLIRR